MLGLRPHRKGRAAWHDRHRHEPALRHGGRRSARVTKLDQQRRCRGGTCWISGQLSIGEDGRYQPGTAREEAVRAFDLVFRIAAEAGFQRDEMVYVDLAFRDLDDLPEVNRLYAELFHEGRRPARSVYQAARLLFGGKIKVQAVAARVP